jgi:hypothetical protein
MNKIEFKFFQNLILDNIFLKVHNLIRIDVMKDVFFLYLFSMTK